MLTDKEKKGAESRDILTTPSALAFSNILDSWISTVKILQQAVVIGYANFLLMTSLEMNVPCKDCDAQNTV